jgi:hypothetical protein
LLLLLLLLLMLLLLLRLRLLLLLLLTCHDEYACTRTRTTVGWWAIRGRPPRFVTLVLLASVTNRRYIWWIDIVI